MRYSPLHLALVISSAVLYGAAYIFPQHLWWTVTIFLIPLFFLVVRDKLILQDGLLWSTIAFSLHLSGVLEGLVLTSEGSGIIRLLPATLVLLTAIGYGFLWFTLSIFFCSSTSSRWGHLAIWVVTTCCYFLFLEHSCLFMLGASEGYLLCNPLVPLVHYPQLLYYVPKIGSVPVLIFFVVTQAIIAAACIWTRSWFCVALCLSIWLSGIVISHRQAERSFTNLDGIVCGSAYFKQNDNITYTGRVIRDYCKAVLKKYLESNIIIFPETAIRCPILPGEPQIIELFNHEHLGKPVTILTGGFRWDDNMYRNVVYWIHDGKVVDLFDKRHAMALTERAPSEFMLGNISLIKDSYFKTFAGIVPHQRKRPVWHISPDLTIIPYICSELFFNNYPDHAETQGAILVALCNDGWLLRDFMRYQMLMGARYRAIQWQTPILYVAHFYQMLCEPSGACRSLKIFNHNKK